MVLIAFVPGHCLSFTFYTLDLNPSTVSAETDLVVSPFQIKYKNEFL